MINYHRVQRIKSVIYALVALLLFLPFVMIVVIFFSIAGKLDDTAGTLGKLETMMSDYYESQAGAQSPVSGVENQALIPNPGSSSSASSPEGGDSSRDTSGTSPEDDMIMPEEDEDGDAPEDNSEDNSIAATEPVSGASPNANLTVNSASGSNKAESSGGDSSSVNRTWNPDSGR